MKSVDKCVSRYPYSTTTTVTTTTTTTATTAAPRTTAEMYSSSSAEPSPQLLHSYGVSYNMGTAALHDSDAHHYHSRPQVPASNRERGSTKPPLKHSTLSSKRRLTAYDPRRVTTPANEVGPQNVVHFTKHFLTHFTIPRRPAVLLTVPVNASGSAALPIFLLSE